MSIYVRIADLEQARGEIRLAPGAHHPDHIAGAHIWAILYSGMSKRFSPAERKRWAELADELGRRFDAAVRWGFKPGTRAP